MTNIKEILTKAIGQEHEDSEFVSRLPCDACGSRDNAALFSDGHTYCFGCQAYTSGSEASESKTIATPQQHTHHSLRVVVHGQRLPRTHGK